MVAVNLDRDYVGMASNDDLAWAESISLTR